jgi:ABC-type uncharacterized transport system permease subunit
MTANELTALAITIAFGALVSGSPLLFATIGEIFSERAGVMNLGLEGMMLVGAMSGFAVWAKTDSLILGMIAGMALGALFALLHAFITITLRADQVVSGLAVTFLGVGLSSILGQPYVGQRVPEPTTLILPILGNVALEQIVLIIAGMIFAPLAWYYLNRINVYRTRYAYVLFGGAMSGLGGAVMSLVTDPGWVDGKTSGLGWIAVALVIFATWDPMRGMWVSYFFGLLRRLPLDLQNPALPFISTANNPQLGRVMDMLPYIATIFILILGSREAMRKRLGAPAALGNPYVRGERGL